MLHFFFFLMIHIHPSVFTPLPKAGEDPFNTKTLPENLGFVARMKEGLIYVYNDAAAADKHHPKDLPCPDYNTFIDDMNFLIALIAQGPTWVPCKVSAMLFQTLMKQYLG